MFDMKEYCFICGKEIKGNSCIVYMQDDNQASQYVGPNCYKKVLQSGKTGYSKGNTVKLFATIELAQRSQK